MAENQNEGQERTEEPTEKRQREAREQGQVPRSRELATAAVFGAGVLSLMSFGSWMAVETASWMRDSLARAGSRITDINQLPDHFFTTLGEALQVIAPVTLCCLLAGLLAPLLLGGLNWSNKSLTPDISKLNPMRGLQRIYGREGLAELVRSLLRVLVIGDVGGYTIYGIAPELVALMHEPLPLAAGHGFDLALETLVAMAFGIALIAALDAPFQMWSTRKKLMMTRQEVRDEMKETEGSPEVKSKIRRMQQEAAQGRMMEAIPTADAILVNPTHYAVAIRYDAATMRAPRVVAKGVDLIARTIREVGERHKVPIVEAPALARSLYSQVPIGREIPVNLYAAIAQVLTYVYQLRRWRREGGQRPELPPFDV